MLRLRPYKRCDADYIVSWLKDEATLRKWSADQFSHFPITAEDLNNHYDSYADFDNYYEMTAFAEKEPVAHMIMRFLDEDKTLLRFGFIIVDDSKRGKGYGKELLKLALKYAFEILKAEKVNLGVFENNPAAYRCYVSLGFRDTGEREHFYLMGEDWTYQLLETDKDTFLS